ncbi:LuxR C-terminal-related transcriptional regulator [Thermogemmatispora onikobensis]|uniref:LuxR C-terminal-related transcriptional regulator n=1 Tax=Thermogemmatispora onikobensis TaxID=732234 RepID=UPI000853A9BE|nr:LuxR C-terminal-related transcriptional regulator [Thermogemmatispora onikobensis]
MHCGESPTPTQTASEIEIVWLPKQEDYALRLKPDNRLRPLPRQQEEWRTWLERQSAFTFKGQCGRLIVRRETRKGRPIYWYAFRHCLHRTFKQYVGKTEAITLERLEEVAGQLEQACLRLHEYMRARHEQRLREAGEPLLLAKLRPPTLSGDLIRREALLALLDRGGERRLILLCAPAGSGKTSLIRQWLAHRQEEAGAAGASPVAWLTLDAADNDATRFWRYLVSACAPWLTPEESQRLTPGPSSALAASLVGLAPVGVAASAISEPLTSQLISLLNLLNEREARGLLILDNYHLINTEAIHQVLALLLDHLPPGLCLVLLTREEPPLPLASLRAAGALLELRGPELRLSQAESAAFLRPYGLSTEQLEQIDQLIAGWPAGLRLLSLLLESAHLAGERDGRPLAPLAPAALERLLSDFRGSQRPLFDYFSSEVLQGLPLHLQDFLLRTCWLQTLQPELCRAVSGYQESATLLEELERSDLFIELLDPESRTYRYYPLFAEALQHEARRRLPPDEVRVIYYQASRWYADHDQFNEAIELALQAGISQWAADLIERLTVPLRLRLQQDDQSLQRLRRWLAALPEAITWSRPQLCILSVLSILATLFEERRSQRRERHLSSAEEARISALLKRAEELWRESNDQEGLARLHACRVLVLGRLPGSPEEAARRFYESVVYARTALEHLAPDESDWRHFCLDHLFAHAVQSGHLIEADQLSRQIESLMQQSESSDEADSWSRGISGLRAFVLSLRGQLYESAHLYRQLVQQHSPQHPLTLLARLGQAQILYDWNDLAGAEEQLRLLEEDLGRIQAEGGSDEDDDPRKTFMVPLLSLLAAHMRTLISQARGQLDEACARLRRLLLGIREAFPTTDFHHHLLSDLLVWLARLELARGNIEAARDGLDELGRILGLPAGAPPGEASPSLDSSAQAALAFPASASSALDEAPDSEAEAVPRESGAPGESQPGPLAIARPASNALILEQYQLLSARLLLAEGQLRQARLLLEEVHERARQCGRGRGLLLARLLLARAYAQQRDPVLAGTYLCRALEQGQVEGHRRIFLDEGEPLAVLLRELLPRVRGQILRAYAESLLQDFAAARSQQPPIVTTVEAALPEPFSVQELRVLRLLALGYSNADIARELIVSVNTVRTHVRHIYQKLNVHSRHRAIAAARRYGLL